MNDTEIIKNEVRKLAPIGCSIYFFWHSCTDKTIAYNVLVINNGRIYLLDAYLPFLGIGKFDQSNPNIRSAVIVAESQNIRLVPWEIPRRKLGSILWNDEDAFQAEVNL